MKDVLNKLTGLIFFALPASAVWIDHGASGSTALLLIISLIGLIIGGHKVDLNRDEAILLLLFLIFAAYSFMSWWWHGMDESGIKHIGKHFRFILFIPVYFWVRRIQPRSEFLWYGVIVGSIISLLVALYGARMYGMDRAHGAVHPILFGDMALILGFMSFAAKDALQAKSVIWRVLPVVALFSGIIASILSGSRGAWIAVPVLLLILFAVRWRTISIRSRVTVCLLAFVLPVLIYLAPATGVEKRIDQALSDVEKYMTGKTIDTSLGLRFESWKAAYYMAVENPLSGVGLGNFQQEAKVLVDKGIVRKGADNFNHTHNDYFYQLSVNGAVGLFLLVLMFVYPLILFYKSISSSDLEIKAFAVAGTFMVVAFMQYALSETVMVRSSLVSFYGFFVIVLIALMHNRLLYTVKD